MPLAPLLCPLSFLALSPAPALAGGAAPQKVEFSRFSAVLPEGWEGEERRGFVSDNPDECLLALGKKDPAGDEILAQISVYLLPNKNGVAPEEAARQLAEAQGGSDKPVQEGPLWHFTGEPRSRLLQGRASTYANASKKTMLVVVIQDPRGLGAESVWESLRGLDPEARELLGR